MSNQQDGKKPSPQELRILRQSILESEQFAGLPTLGPLLEFFFDRAIDGPISRAELLKAKCFKGRNIKDYDPSPRPEVSKLRRALREYFLENLFREPLQIEIPKGRYQLVFPPNKPLVDQSQHLNQFWLPYLAHKKFVRLIIGSESPYWDSQPKGHESGLPIKGELNTVHVPTGLFEAAFTINKFLTMRVGEPRDSTKTPNASAAQESSDDDSVRRSVPFPGCQLDTSLEPEPPDGSVVIFRDSSISLPELRHVSPVLCFPEERQNEDIFRGTVADHFREVNGSAQFRCYAQVLRTPLSPTGFVALQFLAYHSVAVEAAAKFLVSSGPMKHLHKRLTKGGGRHAPFEVGFPMRPDLAPAVQELALLFRVTCSLKDASGLRLRPGIPRPYLRIEKTELIRVDEPTVNRVELYDPSQQDDGWS